MTTSTLDDRHVAALAEMAELLGVNLNTDDPLERLQLGRAVALALEIDRLDAAQRRGEPIDIVARTKASELLEAMIAPPAEGPDLSHLSDDALQLVTRAREVMDGRADPGNEAPLAEAKARYDAECESHRLTISCLQDERRQREQLTDLAAERWAELERLKGLRVDDQKLIEALQALNATLEERIGLYRRLDLTGTAGATP